jgi:membrane protein YqaA with SNARE-associated domain
MFLQNKKDSIMLRRLYDWTIRLADHPQAIWALALVAFIESSFFPIPPDALLIPMIIAAPQKAWKYAFVALFFSVLGGLFGYAIGALAFEQIGKPILASLGKTDAMESFAQAFNEVGIITVLTAGVTPIPYKVITIMSGATAMSLPIFIATSIVARSIRFFLVAALLKYFGPAIREFIEKYLGWVFLAGIVVLIGGFAMVRYLG